MSDIEMNDINEKKVIFMWPGLPHKFVKKVAERFSVHMKKEKFMKIYYEELKSPYSFIAVDFVKGSIYRSEE